ncbi:MAG: T9SS type A sorting domain-containing protein [Bacteroidota bacterium]
MITLLQKSKGLTVNFQNVRFSLMYVLAAIMLVTGGSSAWALAGDNLAISSKTATTVTLTWSSGQKVLCVIALGTSTATPTNGVIYTASTVFGSGQQTQTNPSSGTFVALSDNSGPGTTGVTITGLTTGSTYTVKTYKFDNQENYTASTAGTQTFIAQDAPLPVELASFDLKAMGEKVKLSWVTASETENAGFELMRAEGNGQYRMIASHYTDDALKGLGNSPTGKKYTFTDDQDLQPGRTYTYKLVDVSTDGIRTEKDQKSIEIIDEIKWSAKLYPNPAIEFATIDFTLAEDDAVTINIFDITGKSMMAIAPKDYTAGSNTERISLAGFPIGFYTVRISSSNGISTKSLIVSK